MTDDSSPADDPSGDNNPPVSISELAFALKRTLEDRFGHVRLRGEISKVNRHASGHVYLTLKDDRAALDGVIWKGQVRGLSVQPEAGLEVIATGKITSYPARSSYQIVIESLEAAGEGALLAQLERLKAKLREEGLFEPARKRPLPAFPAVIGVVTSPTGAVIRDILHRIRERWPCRVVVWPVAVQGETAARQVAAAVRGFNALAGDGPVPRPDVLVVARGGGSVEDLWPFNDEALARAVAACAIPVVSAVGHETDTTLIDFVSDRRAPTPTGAAEIITPVRSELAAALADLERRRLSSATRRVEDGHTRLRATARGLPRRPEDLLALPRQRLDLASSRLSSSLAASLGVHGRRFALVQGRLGRGLLDRGQERRTARLDALSARLITPRALEQGRHQLAMLARTLNGLNPTTPKPGFARVEDQDGQWLKSAAQLSPGQAVALVFADARIAARIEDGTQPQRPSLPAPPPRVRRKPGAEATDQGDLF